MGTMAMATAIAQEMVAATRWRAMKRAIARVASAKATTMRMAAARAMMIAMRVAGNKKGYGKGGKVDGDGDKGVGQGMVAATKRAIATAARVVGDKEGDGNEEGNISSNKGNGQRSGQWQGRQGQFSMGHITCAHLRANHQAHSTGFSQRHICTRVLVLLCTFLEPSKKMDLPVPLSKRCTRDQITFEITASIEVHERINLLCTMVLGQKLAHHICSCS
jgi:hypothetical protein